MSTLFKDSLAATNSVKNYAAGSVALTLASVSRLRSLDGSGSTQYDGDLEIDYQASGLIAKEWDVIATVTGSFFGTLGVKYRSLTPDIATIDDSGSLTWVSDGYARILVWVETAGGIRVVAKHMTCYVSTSEAQESSTPTGNYQAGSLGKHLHDTVQGWISGLTPTNATMKAYNDGGHTRNESCFNFPASTAFVSILQNRGILMEPGDIIIAAYHASVGYNNNGLIAEDGSKIAGVNITDSRVIEGTDIIVYLCSRKLTYVDDGILPALTPPANITTYLPSLSTDATVPAICSGTHNVSGVADGNRYFQIGGIRRIDTSVQYIPSAAMSDGEADWWLGLRGGDSGHANGLPVTISGEQKLVALGTWWHGNASLGDHSFIGAYLTEINNAITSLRGGDDTQGLTVADLSEYNAY